MTVRSVPTPYTDSSAWACAALTPAASEFTIITSAMAIASPAATMIVCFLRPASSRRR